ncbi:MAG: helix-turn-helix domain-containing protein [Planctomycetota bacterium]
MSRKPRTDPKRQALKERGVLYARHQRVTDTLFARSDFFDPRDVVQVKYEMVRRVEVEGESVTQACAAFGFSRPSFYKAQLALQRAGLPGLMPRRRGPKRAHKLTDEVMGFIRQQRAKDKTLRTPTLAQQVKQCFGITIHPRTIERALARPGKKRHVRGPKRAR